MIRLLGIDPGLASTGFGIIEVLVNSFSCIHYGTINTSPQESTGKRLLKIYDELSDIIHEFEPSEAAVECLYFAKNISSAMPVAQARGVILLLLANEHIVTKEYPPQEIKQAIVGHGRAKKEQIQELVRLLLGLQSVPKPDHAADALAAAICHHHSRALTAEK